MIYEQGDKRAASNVLHKIIDGQQPDYQGFQLDALVIKALSNNIVTTAWDRFTKYTSLLGNISAFLIGLYTIFRAIRFTIQSGLDCTQGRNICTNCLSNKREAQTGN